jgi:transcriptional regulator with XRE-family HTH domain
MTLSERLKLLREKAGLSATALSLKANLSKNTVSQLEDDPDRSPSVQNAINLAKVLGVSFSYLALGEEDTVRTPERDQATPWTPPSGGGERPDLDECRRKLPQTMAPNAREPALFKLNITVTELGYRSGDIIVVDLKKTAKDGDIVLAKVMDLSDGSSSLIVRRLFSPFLISSALDEQLPMIVADGARTTILGVVAASFRTPQLDPQAAG